MKTGEKKTNTNKDTKSKFAANENVGEEGVVVEPAPDVVEDVQGGQGVDYILTSYLFQAFFIFSSLLSWCKMMISWCK